MLVWDIHDPVNPKQLSWWKTGATGTHRDSYPGGRYVNMSAGMPGYKGQILVFLDISDPSHPKEAGRWWMPGQKDGEPPLPRRSIGFHGPATIEGDRAFLGYSPAAVILDIADISKPKLVGQFVASPPFGTNIPVHSVTPIPGKSLMFVNGEGTGGADTADGAGLQGSHVPHRTRRHQGPGQAVSCLDAADTGASQGRALHRFLRQGRPVRAAQHEFTPAQSRRGEAGRPDLSHLLQCRAASLRHQADPRLPKETGWFIPPTPTKRRMPQPFDKLVSQSEDVLVDTRGNIYITNKQWGLFILRYTGPDQPAPTAK